MDNPDAQRHVGVENDATLLRVFGIAELAENVLCYLHIQDLFRVRSVSRHLRQQVTGYIDSFRRGCPSDPCDMHCYRMKKRKTQTKKKGHESHESQALTSSSVDFRYINPRISQAIICTETNFQQFYIVGNIVHAYDLDPFPWYDTVLSRPNMTEVILLEASAFLRESLDEMAGADPDTVEFYRPRPDQLTPAFFQRYCDREPLVMQCRSGLTLGVVLEDIQDRPGVRNARPFALVFDERYLQEAARELSKAALDWVAAKYEDQVPYGRSWWHTDPGRSWMDETGAWSNLLDDYVWPIVEEAWSSGFSEYAWSIESDE